MTSYHGTGMNCILCVRHISKAISLTASLIKFCNFDCKWIPFQNWSFHSVVLFSHMHCEQRNITTFFVLNESLFYPHSMLWILFAKQCSLQMRWNKYPGNHSKTLTLGTYTHWTLRNKHSVRAGECKTWQDQPSATMTSRRYRFKHAFVCSVKFI